MIHKDIIHLFMNNRTMFINGLPDHQFKETCSNRKVEPTIVGPGCCSYRGIRWWHRELGNLVGYVSFLGSAFGVNIRFASTVHRYFSLFQHTVNHQLLKKFFQDVSLNLNNIYQRNHSDLHKIIRRMLIFCV